MAVKKELVEDVRHINAERKVQALKTMGTQNKCSNFGGMKAPSLLKQCRGETQF